MTTPVRPLTAEWLSAVVKAREIKRGSELNCALREYVAASRVLQVLLGYPWFEERIQRAPEGSFLTPKPEDAFQAYKHHCRVVDLAEILFNLQLIEGVDARIEDLRTVDLESALAELQGARVLYESGTPFRFVVPTGVAGADYDVEALIGAGNVPCEMKCKLEMTIPSSSSVVNTIERARDQLPALSSSVVFLWVPDNWVVSETGRTAILTGVERALRSTGRIARVIVHWEEWRELKPEGALRVVRLKEWNNSRARVPLLALDRALSQGGLATNWIHFHALLCAPEEVNRARLMATMMQADDWARGQGPPPPDIEGAVLYRGNLAELRSSRPSDLMTVVDFECEHLELFELAGARSHESANINLENGPVRQFVVCRGPKPTAYQLQLPAVVHDESLTSEGTGTAPPLDHGSAFKSAVDSGRPAEEVDDGDTFLQALRLIFAELRNEGDLVRPRHLLTSLVVWYRTQGDDRRIYEVLYHNRPILA